MLDHALPGQSGQGFPNRRWTERQLFGERGRDKGGAPAEAAFTDETREGGEGQMIRIAVTHRSDRRRVATYPGPERASIAKLGLPRITAASVCNISNIGRL